SKHRLVIKIGSSLVTNDGNGLDHQAIAHWAQQIAQIDALNHEVVLVSSGAIAEGMKRLGWSVRPKSLHQLQAAASVGQMGLVQVYESCFRQYGLHTAQLLLTHDDLANRLRYLNAKSTLRTLLELNVIPIINENDTVVTDEIRFGDNDTLAALVANLIEADQLIILTDQTGLYSADPRHDRNASLIHEILASDSNLESMAGGAGSAIGSGGMLTKVRAAKRAARSGAVTIIACGREPDVLTRLILKKEAIGSRIIPGEGRQKARKQWLASRLKSHGTLILDEGAIRAVTQEGKSLLPVGVKGVNGTFSRGEMVRLTNDQDKEIGRGLVNYSHDETLQIMHRSTTEIEAILGYIDEPELVHRDNLVLNL
ncbi:MAG: glutamate 5-kinase, partial [Pseudomonadota bacterium]|nr:glutamate 5-kinase [Pseudomonadota bacterium]